VSELGEDRPEVSLRRADLVDDEEHVVAGLIDVIESGIEAPLLVESAVPDPGRVRSFLCASVKHFFAKRDKEQALKRAAERSRSTWRRPKVATF